MTNSYFLRNTRPTPISASIQERFDAAVANTGNYFFEEALNGHLDGMQIAFSFDELPERVDTLVLSMSNFISPTTDLGWFCDEIEARKIEHVVMVGAGAQADDYGDKVHLTDGTTRFLKLLADRSESIGVRGYFTAEVLAGIGIKNCEVIGCPTAFWSKGSIIPAPQKAPQRIAVHCTPSGYYRDKVGGLFSHAIRYNANYIIQSEQWLMPLVVPELADRRQALNSDNHIAYYGRHYYDPKEFNEWLEKAGLVYFGMQEWISAMSTFDFVYGSRFHGNMAAIQAGTPALNMPFDTRTRELCEYLNLPHIPFADFDPELPPAKLLEWADFSLFYKTYESRAASYQRFLERNGLNTCLNFTSQSVEANQNSDVVRGNITQLLEDYSAGLVDESILASELNLRVRKERSLDIRKRVQAGEAIENILNA